MERFKRHKAVTLLLYLAQLNGGTFNKMKALKLIWLADRYHLRKHGRSITGDRYFAMERGTVPSSVKNIIEAQNGMGDDCIQLCANGFEFNALGKPDLDFLSISDQEAVDVVLNAYLNRDQFSLSELSHTFPEWMRYESQLPPKGSSKRIPMIMEDFFKNVDDPAGIFQDDEDYLAQSLSLYREYNYGK